MEKYKVPFKQLSKLFSACAFLGGAYYGICGNIELSNHLYLMTIAFVMMSIYNE